MDGCGGLSAIFIFDDHIDGVAYKTRLSAEQQEGFKTAFCTEVKKVADWFEGKGWLTHPPKAPPPIGTVAGNRLFNLADADVQVYVSNDYKLSRCLVPAALGRRGHMEFPLYRVVSNEAAIAHEITHLYFPNGNRMLAEGFAVHMQQEIGSNPAYPNFKYDLDQAVHALVRQSGIRLDDVDLAALDQMSTPDELILKIGAAWYADNVTYLLAGSFVKFLIEKHSGGLPKFRELYDLTPLKALDRNAGAADRWKSVYGAPLATLEAEWKQHLKSLPHPAAPIDQDLFRLGPQAMGLPPDHPHHRRH